MCVYIQEEYVIERWCFNKADWNRFKEYCIENSERLLMEGDVSKSTEAITSTWAMV